MHPLYFQHKLSSEYNPTQFLFCNAHSWLFPGGIGDLYDIKRGKNCPKEWGRHLLHHHDGRFLKDQMFPSLFLTALNVTRITDRAVTSLTAENFLARTLPLLNNSRKNWNVVTTVTFKCFVTIHVT